MTDEVPMTKKEKQIEELATSEDLDVLWGALYSALEADLSAMGWPGNSKTELETASEWVETVMEEVENYDGK